MEPGSWDRAGWQRWVLGVLEEVNPKALVDWKKTGRCHQAQGTVNGVPGWAEEEDSEDRVPKLWAETAGHGLASPEGFPGRESGQPLAVGSWRPEDRNIGALVR